MFGLLKSVTDLAIDVTKIATAPVEIAIEVVKAPVSEVAKVAESLVSDVKNSLK